MRRIFNLLLLLTMFCSKLFAQTLERDTISLNAITIISDGKKEVINWQSLSLEQALAKAKEADKHVLIYFTAKWCGPCRKMEQEVFPAYEVIRAVNDNYIALKIDVDAWGGKKWIEEFSIKGMPEFFILNNDKKRLRHNLGAIPKKEFLSFLNLEQSPVDVKMLDTTHAKAIHEKWKSKADLGFGAGISSLSNSTSNDIFGYEIKLGYSLQKKRLFINPEIGFTSVGSSTARLNYAKLPIQIGLNFYRGSLLGLAGGYRILAGPYYGRLINSAKIVVNKNDVGLDYGLGVYIGDASNASLEFSIKGSKGFSDILTQTGKQTNQFFRAGITLFIRKG